MHHDQAVIRLGHIQKGRRAAVGRVGFVIKTLIHLVGQHPGAGVAAVRQNVSLFGAAERPACRVVGRIDDQHTRRGRDGGFERRHVELPLAVHGTQRHALQIRAHHQRLRRQVGPHGCHGDHFVTGIDEGLRRQHQGVHAARGDGQTVHSNGAMQGRHVISHRLAQLRQAQVVRIKGLALLQRIDGGLAHDVGRDLVRFTKPKGQYIGTAHARVGNFTDARLFQVHDGLAHERGGVFVHAAILMATPQGICLHLRKSCACL